MFYRDYLLTQQRVKECDGAAASHQIYTTHKTLECLLEHELFASIPRKTQGENCVWFDLFFQLSKLLQKVSLQGHKKSAKIIIWRAKVVVKKYRMSRTFDHKLKDLFIKNGLTFQGVGRLQVVRVRQKSCSTIVWNFMAVLRLITMPLFAY